MALLGTFEELPPIIAADTKCVASYNTLTLMSASEQIYSRDVNFKIINSTGVVNEIGVAELAADSHIVLTKGT